MPQIRSGELVSWQRQLSKAYTGTVLAFCPKGTAISETLDLSKYPTKELSRIDPRRNSIDRYLIYVPNVGVVSVSSTTIEKHNPDAQRVD